MAIFSVFSAISEFNKQTGGLNLANLLPSNQGGGEAPQGSPTPSYSEAVEIVKRLYREILGREADAGGLEANAQSLSNGTLSEEQVRRNLQESLEARNYQTGQYSISTEEAHSIINTGYAKYFLRTPTSSEVNTWLPILTSGRWTKAQFEAELLNAPESKSRGISIGSIIPSGISITTMAIIGVVGLIVVGFFVYMFKK